MELVKCWRAQWVKQDTALLFPVQKENGKWKGFFKVVPTLPFVTAKCNGRIRLIDQLGSKTLFNI